MSEHWRNLRNVDGEPPAPRLSLDDLTPKWVLQHRGTCSDYRNRYRRLAAKASRSGLAGLRSIAPYLLEFISDERMLHLSWTSLSLRGGHSAGPDGWKYSDIPSSEVWRWCRELRDEIRAGEYKPGDERLKNIPKSSGGYRKLVIQNLDDRVVQRATVEVLQPLLDPLFLPRSFGYRPRPNGGPLRALATADTLHRFEKRNVWVSVDCAEAFSRVPLPRLVDLVKQYLPDDSLTEFVRRVVTSNRVPGLRQGGPASPVLLNLYLHHLLDLKWTRLHPKIPLVRFADDILIACKNEANGYTAYDRVSDMLHSAGMKVKESKADAVHDLGRGGTVEWMGYRINEVAGTLQYAPRTGAWGRLAEQFQLAHEKPNSPLVALQSLRGWISYYSPCYSLIDIDHVYARIISIARQVGFHEMLERHELKELWIKGHEGWSRLREEVASSRL